MNVAVCIVVALKFFVSILEMNHSKGPKIFDQGIRLALALSMTCLMAEKSMANQFGSQKFGIKESTIESIHDAFKERD